MREYLFRGRRVDNGEWVEGDLSQDRDLETAYIQGWDYYSDSSGLQREPFAHQVDPATVGQYVGGKDTKDIKIFKDDICTTYNGKRATIKWGKYQDQEILDIDEKFYEDSDREERHSLGFYAEVTDTEECFDIDDGTEIWLTVIGNIHDKEPTQ